MSIKETKLESNNPDNSWDVKRSIAHRDLVIKKVAITLILLINLAGIGVGLAYLSMYVSVPTEALIVSPFIAGVIGALVYLKYPTLGLDSSNYTTYTNPALMIGKIVTYIFLGPVAFFAQKVDFNPYHDPYFAKRLATELREKPFDFIAQKYGSHMCNLVDYGFIPEKYRDEIVQLYKTYTPIRRGLAFFKKEYGDKSTVPSAQLKTLETQNEEILQNWVELRDKFADELPCPEEPKIDFSATTLFKIKSFLRELTLYPYQPYPV